MERAILRRALSSIEVRVLFTALVQFTDALARLLSQRLHGPELDRRGRTRLGAGRRHSVFLAVIAERALVSTAVFRAAVEHAERAGHHAIGAPVVDDGPSRTRVITRRRHAVLADIAHH